MTINAGTVYVDVKANTDGLTKSIGSGVDKLRGKLTSVGKGLTLGVTAPIVALGASSVAAFEESQQVARVFEQTLDNVGLAGEVNARRVEDSFSKLGEEIGIQDEELTALAGKLASAIDFSKFGDAEKALEKVTLTVENFSAQTGKSATLASKLFASIANDPASALGTLVKLGVITKKQSDAYAKMIENGKGAAVSQELLNAAAKKYKGAAAAAATPSEKLAVAFDNFKETIGKFLLPLFKKFSGFVTDLFHRFEDLSPSMKKVILIVGGAAAALGPVLIITSKLIGAIGAIGKAFSAVSALLAANPWVLILAGIVLVAVLIIKNWDKVKKFLLKTWDILKKAALAVWNVIRKGWDILVAIVTHSPLFLILKAQFLAIKAVVTTVVGFVIDHWRGFFNFFKEAIHTIASVWSTVWGGIKTFFVGIWSGIKTAASGALNFVIDLLNGVIRGLNLLIQGLNDANGPLNFLDLPKVPTIPHLAEGGIVNRPTLAMIGEAGPEAVIPLRGGGGQTLRIVDWRHGIAELGNEQDWADR